MIFTSARYLVFLAGTLLLLALVSGRDLKKRLLAAASCFFYAAWDWRYLGLLLAVSVIDYCSAARIAASNSPRVRRGWLLASVASNLGMLGYFKYCNFFIENFDALTAGFGFTVPRADVLLPVGISFYTFKTMSYTIDVYRGQLQPCRSWLDYATFITFFPELIAGPIVRASIFLPQLEREIGPTRQRLISGMSLFLLGLAKKLLIADRMAEISDTVFATPGIFSTATVWCGVAAYTLQIYGDFSGYSDMAIGSARMIGYDLPENFRMPYLSTSITEFWRRWHMTLSAWLKDYLYIPLGGNRQGTLMTYRNLFLTMLLGGLWHGADWNFVLWGGLHGGALAANKLWRKVSEGRWTLPAPLGWLLTMTFVMVCWVPFRSASFSDTVLLLKRMAGFGAGHYQWLPIWLFVWLGLCVLGHWIGWCIEKRAVVAGWGNAVMPGEGRAQAETHAPFRPLNTLFNWLGIEIETHELSGAWLVPKRVTVAGAYAMAMVILMILFFAPFDDNPFIYFQF
ncbi:MAG TPA: MBOAT family protein [Verrucomicrobiae bacterium]|jgi:alginate O-acetyltransferase complex protein AlgI|nr:MBOAT family protein [Verrucomicrobiae bacterium]